MSIRLGNSEETVRGLLSYETDVAVLAQYGANPLLHYVPYRQHPLVIIVPATHRVVGLLIGPVKRKAPPGRL